MKRQLDNYTSNLIANSNIIDKDNYNIVQQLLPIYNLRLVYQASRDGYEVESFAQYVEGKSGIVLMCKTLTGRVFGFYISVELHFIHNYYTYDNNTFMFSVDMNERYYKNKPRVKILNGCPACLQLFNNVGHYQSFYLTKSYDLRYAQLDDIFGSVSRNDDWIHDTESVEVIEAYDFNILDIEAYEVTDKSLAEIMNKRQYH